MSLSENAAAPFQARPFQANDLDRLHQINEACTPGVSRETRDDLEEIISLSECWVVIDADDAPVGFITLIEPGTLAYKSPNLRWFETWATAQSVSVIYIDRIAFAPQARGNGLGAGLYEAAALGFPDRDYLVAEVNTRPDNPGSHRFHQSFGFERVGEQGFSPDKAVAYYALPLKGRGDTD